MTTPQSPPDLRVNAMRVVWRNTFIIEDAPRDVLDRAAAYVRRLPCYVADAESEYEDQPEMFRVVNRVSRNVAPLGYSNQLRVQFASLRVADLRPTLDRWHCGPDRLTPEQVKLAADDAHQFHAWINITPMLVLHRAGVGMVEYHARIETPADVGYTPNEAVRIVRLGIHTELISITGAWCGLMPDDHPDWGVIHLLERGDDDYVAVAGLRDLSSVVGAHITTGVGLRPYTSIPQRSALRPTSSTSVVLLETDPPAGDDIGEYVSEHAPALRGIGAMDTDWQNRAVWLVERELSDNLSTDAELGLYLLGSSELLLFNHRLSAATDYNIRKLRLKDTGLASTYFYMHYLVLLSWVYLQEAILKSYIQRLDELAATSPPDRKLMIDTLHNALADLIQYQEDITPYATRIEFIQRTQAYHQLDQLAERFERKQDLLLNYSSEYHDYRETREAEFLNWLAALLAGGELGNLIVNATGTEPAENPLLYLGVTVGSIVLAIVIMLLLRLRNR